MSPSRYPTPVGFRAALEARLRRRASGDGLELQRVRQLVVFERFLARLVAEFEDGVVLKGGLVLELRLERARTTKDVDLRLVGAPSRTLDRLQRAGRRDLGDHLEFLVVPDPRHPEIEAEGMAYEGLRFRVEPRIADKIYGRPFGVDVAFAEPLGGPVELIEPPGWLDFAGVEPPAVPVYPLETHIAEKLHAYTLPRSRPNSRVKDLPDIALLATVRPIEAESLRRAIARTWTHRGTHPLPDRVPAPPESWERPYAELARTNGLRWGDLGSVADAVAAFLDPVLDQDQPGLWTPEEWRWG